MKGRVNLLYNGAVLKTALFPDSTKLNIRLDDWKKLYGRGFKKIKIEIEIAETPTMKKSNFRKGDLPKLYNIKKAMRTTRKSPNTKYDK